MHAGPSSALGPEQPAAQRNAYVLEAEGSRCGSVPDRAMKIIEHTCIQYFLKTKKTGFVETQNRSVTKI